MRGVRNAELWGGLAWFVLGLAVALGGHKLGLGALNEPGSGFAPFWLGILIMLLASTIILGALLHGGADITRLWAGTRWGKVLVVCTALIVYGLLFETVGFIALTLILLTLLMFFIDRVTWRIALPVSLIAVVGVWAALTKWLKIQIPAGILSDWLGF